jgi:hypothetical protein
MRIRKTLLLCVLAILSTIAIAASSQAEQRFGPWAYFAPYYFPPDGCCLGYCFGPDDFRPRYESPNPPIPSHDIGACLGSPQPAPYPKKVAPPRHISRSAPSMAPVPRLKESRPSPSTLRAIQPSPSDRTGVPASITSTPPERNQLPSSGGSLQQPQAVNHPGPQTVNNPVPQAVSNPVPQTVNNPAPQPSDSASRTVTRPLKWGQDRAR